MRRHTRGVDVGDTGRRGDDHPLRAFFLDLVQKRGLACAGLASEKNILACIAHVFECEVELGIGSEAHVLKFATYGRLMAAARSSGISTREPRPAPAVVFFDRALCFVTRSPPVA